MSRPLCALIKQSKASYTAGVCSGPHDTASDVHNTATTIEEFIVDEIPALSVAPNQGAHGTEQMQTSVKTPMAYSVPRKQTAAINPNSQVPSVISEPWQQQKGDVGLGIFLGCLTSVSRVIMSETTHAKKQRMQNDQHS